MKTLNYKFYIDRGGTFTDCYFDSGFETGIVKLLSEDPANYPDAPREAIRRVLAKRHDLAILQDPYKTFPSHCDQYHIETIRMGTTVATNALLEHNGSDFAFVTTKGFADLLEIAYQNRPKIFDLKISKPAQLYSKVIELDERILSTGLEKTLNLEEARSELQALLDSGINKLAIAFLHSYANPVHEQQLKQLALDMGFEYIACSSDLNPMIKIVARADTACIDAYLSPVINNYVKNFRAGFSDALSKTELLFMKSDAGLAQVDNFSGYNSILSGPAGGVVGYASVSHELPAMSQIIGFDMGGTSTDVSRFAGDYDLVFESEINGHRIQSAQLDIQTVAAGGGSRLFYEDGMFKVGPESSGSHPGPVCYGKGGFLSITDANLILGRLLPDHFPKVFGPSADQALDKQAAIKAFEELALKINADRKDLPKLSIEEIANGFVQVANEVMARPMREISIMKGHDLKNHRLACFGGAGGQHACDLARDLGINKVLVHKYSGILSAYGLALADEIVERQCPAAPGSELGLEGSENFAKEFSSLSEGLGEDFEISKYLNLRYQGTDTQMMIEEPEDGDYAKIFIKRYKQEFGFDLQGREILVDDVRARAVKQSRIASLIRLRCRFDAITADGSLLMANSVESIATCKVYFDKWHESPIYKFEALNSDSIQGPAIIMQDTATIVLDPWSEASLNSSGDLEITVKSHELSVMSHELKLDPIKLTIFASRFMSIAEQMGRALEKTSISTNIKERLDFSCAIFDSQASLVANAPHQPVHLGSMGHAVTKQVEAAQMKPGDSFLTNHPSMGGSHLPDLTVVTPVYHELSAMSHEPIFYVANRAHHADIGGISPGSMPSFSTKLDEEGIAIKSFKLVSEACFQETELRNLLASSRTIDDNVSDLKAQVAANTRGIELINALIEEFGQDQVFFYMQAIQDAAESAVRELLRQLMADGSWLMAEDYLDDGSIIKLKVDIDQDTGSAIFDFTGTAAALDNNLNTPEAVTSSAILYALRAMIDKEIPLNQGCLKPITIKIPEGSLLKPADDAAVVAGNVLTSQRIVDVIFKAFAACAASQGCMNNISFGNESFAYYETIGGGAGAGPSWNGASGVHTHMTNTRITDPEILETRYPVILREFSIRHGSGGMGKHQGGDGLVRVFEFLDDLQVSILTERRERAPYGLAGGKDGARGENWLEYAGGLTEKLAAKNSIAVKSQDRLKVLTPGGGAYGC